jgi:AcrR family transcriptional regulator
VARPSRIAEQRKELLPVVTRAFNELGYRGATTAEIARRCGVRENILYRLWEDKKAMFIAAIGHVGDLAVATWGERGDRRGRFSPLAALAYEAEHLGEFGNYRLIFSGLAESDDEEIRGALAALYRRLHGFIAERLAPGAGGSPRTEWAAWTLIGLGTVSTIARELGLLDSTARSRLLRASGRRLMAR